MTRSRQIVRMALPVMAMVAMACGPRSDDTPASAPPTTVSPADAASASPSSLAAGATSLSPAALVKPVTVMISGQSCRHHVQPPTEKLNATNRDALEWRVTNGEGCGSDQKVLICIYQGPSTVKNPFRPCNSTPTAGLDIGSVFTVKRGTRENLNCEASVEGKYRKLVLVGREVPIDGRCPRTLNVPLVIASGVPPDGESPRPPMPVLTHILDVEIVR